MGGQFAPTAVADDPAAAGDGLSLDEERAERDLIYGDMDAHNRAIRGEYNALRLGTAGYEGRKEWAEPPPAGLWQTRFDKLSDVGRHRVWHRTPGSFEQVAILERESLSKPDADPKYMVMYGVQNFYKQLGDYGSVEEATSAAETISEDDWMIVGLLAAASWPKPGRDEKVFGL